MILKNNIPIYKTKILFIFAFCLLDCFALNAQMFKVLQPDSIVNNKVYYTINKKNFVLPIENNLNRTQFKLFFNTKTYVGYFFKEKHSDFSLGCDLYKIETNDIKKLQTFLVAAYTNENNQRMDYNSILPYISIIQAGQRTILSFECPLIVINPDMMSETIEKAKDIYGLIVEDKIEIKKY